MSFIILIALLVTIWLLLDIKKSIRSNKIHTTLRLTIESNEKSASQLPVRYEIFEKKLLFDAVLPKGVAYSCEPLYDDEAIFPLVREVERVVIDGSVVIAYLSPIKIPIIDFEKEYEILRRNGDWVLFK